MKPQQVFSAGYRARFIGAEGKVLMQTESNPAVYQLAGGESYVRAIVTDFYAHTAWIQPVFVRK